MYEVVSDSEVYLRFFVALVTCTLFELGCTCILFELDALVPYLNLHWSDELRGVFCGEPRYCVCRQEGLLSFIKSRQHVIVKSNASLPLAFPLAISWAQILMFGRAAASTMDLET